MGLKQQFPQERGMETDDHQDISTHQRFASGDNLWTATLPTEGQSHARKELGGWVWTTGLCLAFFTCSLLVLPDLLDFPIDRIYDGDFTRIHKVHKRRLWL